MKQIYLDTAAATPLDPQVKRVISEAEKKYWANPSSLHEVGVAAAAALAAARREVAQVIGAHADEIIFTSGGTEANNLAVLGAPTFLPDGQVGEIIVSAIEHSSVLEPAKLRGQVLLAPVDENGQLKLADFKKMLTKQTSLVSIIYAHNEIGTIQDIKAIAKIIRAHRSQFKTALPYFHIDACQATRFLPLNVQQLGVDLMTLNASKMYGPKGVGVLFIKRGVNLAPQILGGGQEAGYRAGTENVPAILGFATALTLAQKQAVKETKKLLPLRDYALKQILKNIPSASLNGDPLNRLPNNLNFSFTGTLGEQVVIELAAAQIAASTGSACAIPKHDDSYVIMALGKDAAAAKSAVRLTFGREITKSNLNYVIKNLVRIINKLKTTNHVYASKFDLWV